MTAALGEVARRRAGRRPSPAATAVAVGYVRVSREEQVREGVSLEAQRARIIAYAEAKDLALAETLADEGLSGKDLNRPALEQLLERCRRGEVSHVIVWKLDRLTRRTRHLLSLVEDLFLTRGIELHSVSESLDTSTPHGRFVLTLFGGLAQMEREQIADRTREALAWKARAGAADEPRTARVPRARQAQTNGACPRRAEHRSVNLSAAR